MNKDPENRAVILSSQPVNLDKFFALIKNAKIPKDFLSKEERKQTYVERDIFADWQE